MVDRTVKVAILIFNAAFPGCQAVFAFDTAPNHCSSASIRGFYRLAVRTIDACYAGLRHGTDVFKQNVYKSHRQVEDRSKC